MQFFEFSNELAIPPHATLVYVYLKAPRVYLTQKCV